MKTDHSLPHKLKSHRLQPSELAFFEIQSNVDDATRKAGTERGMCHRSNINRISLSFLVELVILAK